MDGLKQFRPVLEIFGGDQFKPTVVLLVSPLLMLAWKYFGSPEFYTQYLAPHMARSGNICHDPAATAAIYSFILCFLLMGVVPALIVKFLFKERLRDYGVQLGNRVRTLRSFLLWGPVFVAIAYMASHNPSITAVYPINPHAGASPTMFALHVGTYLLFYLGWEFHFRGFLQFGLTGKLGVVNAVLIQVMASSLLHIGKPTAETFGAIAGGILWGLIAYRTRSLLSGLLQHSLLGIMLDWFICYSA